jgi:protein-L-isoaspartate(D-aspartate) O-methyltransferase
MPAMREQAEKRRRMVETQLIARGIADGRVLEAMGQVPREVFVDEALRQFAYDDTALPIAAEQTISQPYIVALMAEQAQLTAASAVLDIGTGSGYAAAVFSLLAGRVLTIERHAPLAAAAAALLSQLDIRNVSVRTGDGTLGWPEAAPFDAVLAAASAAEIPSAWTDQLAVGGRLILPVGHVDGFQELVQLTRGDDGRLVRRSLGPVMFVPLIPGSREPS